MSETASPRVSVILPVYNAERFLGEAIRSVLDQTFGDFELIIINDGSSDRSGEIARSFTDSRIRYFEKENQGLAETLNYGIRQAKGVYIARQDNDDLSLPDRFSRQVKFLDAKPNTALLGTAAVIIDEQGRDTGRWHRHACENIRLRFRLLFSNPFVHSGVMFRKTIIEKAGMYMKSPDFFEDHNLWSRVARIADVANLPEALLRYREVLSSMSRSTADYREKVLNQSVDNVKHYLPHEPIAEIKAYCALILNSGAVTDLVSARKLIIRMSQKLTATFKARGPVEAEILAEECKRLMVIFKRHYLNGLIADPRKGRLAVASARMQRRILLARYRHIL